MDDIRNPAQENDPNNTDMTQGEQGGYTGAAAGSAADWAAATTSDLDTELASGSSEGQRPSTALALTKLPPDQQKKVKEIANGIKVDDSQAIIQYGAAAQSGVAGFSDTLLREIRTKDTGPIGETLSDLMVEIKGVDVDGLAENDGAISRFFGGPKRKIDKFMAGYQKIGTNIDKLTADLDKAKMQLLRDIKLLDNLYQKNIEYLHSLDVFILAGELKLEELTHQILPAMLAKARETGDPALAQAYKDHEQLANRFEKKIHDLKLSRMIAIQTAPQIRIIQSNNQTLAEKIQSSIMNTIPLWKNQIVIAISLYRQEGALRMQEEVSRTTDELLTKNAEMLKDSSIRVAKASEKGIVEIETLQKVHTNLIQTLEETIRIQQEGKVKRHEAENTLQTIEDELKHKLIELKG